MTFLIISTRSRNLWPCGFRLLYYTSTEINTQLNALGCSSPPYRLNLHTEKTLKHMGGFKEGCYQCASFYVSLIVQDTQRLFFLLYPLEKSSNVIILSPCLVTLKEEGKKISSMPEVCGLKPIGLVWIYLEHWK